MGGAGLLGVVPLPDYRMARDKEPRVLRSASTRGEWGPVLRFRWTCVGEAVNSGVSDGERGQSWQIPPEAGAPLQWVPWILFARRVYLDLSRKWVGGVPPLWDLQSEHLGTIRVSKGVGSEIPRERECLSGSLPDWEALLLITQTKILLSEHPPAPCPVGGGAQPPPSGL